MIWVDAAVLNAKTLEKKVMPWHRVPVAQGGWGLRKPSSFPLGDKQGVFSGGVHASPAGCNLLPRNVNAAASALMPTITYEQWTTS